MTTRSRDLGTTYTLTMFQPVRNTIRGAKEFLLRLAARTVPFALLAAACAHAQTPATFPLLKSCGEGSEAGATIGGSDEVKIRYSFATDSGTCYAVTVAVDGKDVNGYLAGATRSAVSAQVHPAIIAFEQDVRTHMVQIPVAPPPAPAPPEPPKAATPPAPAPPAAVAEAPAPEPVSFAGFRAVDIKGNRVDFSAMKTPNIVLYFWSATDKRAIKKAEAIETIYGEFHARGVDVVGVASARSATQLREVCGDNEFVWPEILDSGGIANRYHVDPAKPYMLLDRNRKVIAAVSSPMELATVLRPLTKMRKVNQ